MKISRKNVMKNKTKRKTKNEYHLSCVIYTVRINCNQYFHLDASLIKI